MANYKNPMNIIEALVQLRDDLKTWVTNNLRTKVDKEDGKVLSSNDFSLAEKTKLGKIALDGSDRILSNSYVLGAFTSYFKTGYRAYKTYTFPQEESKTYYVTLQSQTGYVEQKYSIDALANNVGNRVFLTVNARPYMKASMYGKTLHYNSLGIASVAAYKNTDKDFYHDIVITVKTNPDSATVVDIYSDGNFNLDSSCISTVAPAGAKECEYVVTAEDTMFSTTPIVSDGNILGGAVAGGSSDYAKTAATALKKYRSVVDTKLSPWYLENDGVTITRVRFDKCTVLGDFKKDYMCSDKIEYLIGTITFVDTKYGYIVYDIPDIDGIRCELRKNGKVYNVENGYIISELADPVLWENDFKDKTYEVYLVIEAGSAIRSTTVIPSLVYEAMSVHDITASNLDGFAEIMYTTNASNTSSTFYPDLHNQVINGISFTVNEDGYVYADGTATDDVEYRLGDMTLYYRDPIGRVFASSSQFRFDINISCSPNSDKNYGFALKPWMGNNAESAEGYYVIGDGFRSTVIDNPLPTIGTGTLDGGTLDVVFRIRAGQKLTNQRLGFSSRFAILPLNKFLSNLDNDQASLRNDVNDILEKQWFYDDINVFSITAESQTINGVTFTINEDNSVTINGTPTSTDFEVRLGSIGDISNYPYGVYTQRIGDELPNNVFLSIGSRINNSDIRIRDQFEHFHNIKPYGSDIYIYIGEQDPINNITLKPVIYKCEHIHDIVRQRILTGGGDGSGITMDEVETYVNSQIGLAIGGRY